MFEVVQDSCYLNVNLRNSVIFLLLQHTLRWSWGWDGDGWNRQMQQQQGWAGAGGSSISDLTGICGVYKRQEHFGAMNTS